MNDFFAPAGRIQTVFVSAALLFAVLFASCSSLRTTREMPAETSAETPVETPPEQPAPAAPELIMGKGLVNGKKLARFLTAQNPAADRAFAGDLAGFYIEEAAAEGVNHDVAFAQMCLETGCLRFGGLVTPDMNNFCGLGSTGPGHPGEIFDDPRTGVRAHIQHLKAYATTEPLRQPLVDPRYRYVRYGSSPEIGGLAGTWAADTAYAEKIRAILQRLYQSSFF
ncbi:MAG: glucosaminidase domain-containing protein [Treponema sp.]|jgi:hypothetical protein|nr:glucosaminidase domain-containing protein [Treponema sp.]